MWHCSSTVPDDQNLIPISPNTYSTLRIYLPVSSQDDQQVVLDVYEDLYRNDFFHSAHHNFIIPSSLDNMVVSVLDEPIKGKENYLVHRGIITTKKGYDMIDIMPSEDLGIPLTERLEKALKLMPKMNDDLYHVPNEHFKEDLVKVEEKHCQKKTAIKIGLIYCRKGQTLPQDMFKNGISEDPCSQGFMDFVSLFGSEINLTEWDGYMGDMKPGETGKAFYDRWNNIEVIYHVAPFLNSEGHRRLIGNDIAELFFLEEGKDTLLDPMEVGKLGTVPQVFAVVQPVKDLYRVGFFTNINIKQFGPNIPNRLLKPDEMKDLVLTKLHNGLVMCNSCTPMNRLFYVPRKETIDSLVTKYPMEKVRKHKKKLHPFLKTKSQQLEKKTDHQKYIPDVSFDTIFDWSEIPKIAESGEELEEPQPIQYLQENLRFMLNSFMEILIEDPDKRSILTREILSTAKEHGGLRHMEHQIAKLEAIGQASSKQICAIKEVEVPMLYIQSQIRTWNVHHYMSCRALHTQAWTDFINDEKQYLAQLECIGNFYKKPFLDVARLGKLGRVSETKVNRMFFHIDELTKVSRSLLSRLEVQYSYFPIIYGVGEIFQKLKLQLEGVFCVYFTSFQFILEAWAEAMAEGLIVDVLIAAQKASTFPTMPLSALLTVPIKHLGTYSKAIMNIACELAGIDSKTLPRRPYFLKSASPTVFGRGSKRTVRGSSPSLNSPTDTRNVSKTKITLNSSPINVNTSTSSNSNSPSGGTSYNINSSGGTVSPPCSSTRRRQSQGVIPKFITKNPTPQKSPRTSTIMVPSTSPSGANTSRAKSENEIPETISDEGHPHPPKVLKRSLSKRDKGTGALGIKKKTMSMGDARNKTSPKSTPPGEKVYSPTKLVNKEQLAKLHRTINEKNLHKLLELLKSDRSLVNAQDISGMSPLHIACNEGPLSIIKMLTKNGADIEIQDETGMRPLHVAASVGQYELVEFLLKNGSDPNAIDGSGNTCLHLTVRNKKIPFRSFQKIVDAYVKAGGNMNAKNQFEDSIVHLAVLRGTPDMVSYVLKKGALESLDAVDSNGYTPLKRAELAGLNDFIEVLLAAVPNDGQKENKHIKKKETDTKDINSKLEGKGEDKKDEKTKKGTNEVDLAAAIISGNLPLLTQIMKNGNIDINATLPGRGETPLLLACNEGHLRTVKHLVKNGANWHNSSDTKQTQWPLHTAAISRHWHVVNYLLSKGHDPDAQNIDLNTCLHYVVRNQMTEEIRFTLDSLFKAGANMDARNKNGETPIMTAIQRGGSIEMCQYLLNKGADLNVKNTIGRTPIDCCKEMERHDLVILLEMATANPTTIKISDLLKDDENLKIESQKHEEQTSFEQYQDPSDPILLNQISLLWTTSKFMKRIHKNSTHKMGAKYILTKIKDQLGVFKAEFADGLPSSLILEGHFSIKKQPYIFYLFDTVLVLAVPNKLQKKKVIIKNVIPLRTITIEPEIDVDEEGYFLLRIVYIPPNTTKPEVLEISVPDTTFFTSLTEQLEEANTSSGTEESKDIRKIFSITTDRFDEFKVEMNLGPRMDESIHEDEARSESTLSNYEEKE